MDQSRQTTVTIDLRVGSIELPAGTVHIPAELELKGAGGGAGGAAGGDLSKLLGKLSGILGPQWLRTMQQVFATVKLLIPLLAKGGALLLGIIAAVGTAYIAWKAFLFVVNKVRAALQMLFNVIKRVVTIMWDMNMAVMRFLAMPLKRVLSGTVDVLGMFVGKLREAGQWALRLGEDFVRNAIDTFQDFEQQIANTVSVMGQFGDAAMEMRDQVAAAMIEITRRSRFMASEAAQAAYAVASAGFSTLAEVVDITKASIMAAEATLTDLTQTTQYAMAAINQFGLAASEAHRVMNVFVAAIAQSPATMTKIGQAMEYAGPIAHSFGVSVEAATAALMGFFKQGRSGSRAGTEFRILLASMAKATDKMVEGLGKFGITMDQLSPGRVGITGIVKVFEKLRDTIGQIATVETIYQVLPVRAASALVALLQEGSVSLGRMQEAITGTNRAFQMQQDQLRTLQGAWKILLSKAEELKYQFMERLSPAIVDVVKQLQGLVDWARESGVFKQAGGLLGDGLLYVANLIRSLAAPAFELLKNAAETLIPVVKELAEVVGPLLGKWVQTVFPLLVEIFAQLGRVLTEFLRQNGEAIIEWFRLFLETGLKIANWLPNMLPSLKQMVDLFLAWAPTLAEAVLDYLPKLLELFEKLPGALDQFLKTYIPLLLEGFGSFLVLLEKAVNELLPKLLDLFEALGPDFGKDLDGIVKKLSAIMDKVSEFLSDTGGMVQLFRDMAGALTGLTAAAVPLLNILLLFKKVEITILRIKLFFAQLIPGRIGKFAKEGFEGLGVALESIDKIMDLLIKLETLQNGAASHGGAVRGGMAPAGFGPTAAAGGGFGGNSAGMHKYTITYNVNSLQAMEDIQRREAAKMKDDELRRRKFGSAPEQSTPPTTLRLQRSF